MTPQAVRRKDVYHVNSIESSWIVSEISLFQVKDIIQGAIWIDGGSAKLGLYSYRQRYHKAQQAACSVNCDILGVAVVFTV